MEVVDTVPHTGCILFASYPPPHAAPSPLHLWTQVCLSLDAR